MTTMSDDLRERIAKVLYYRSMHFAVTERVWEEEKDAIYAFRDDAQAIIDDLGLTVGQRICEQGWPNKPPVHQIVGRWGDDE